MPDRIGQLLRAIETSKATFVRGDDEYDGLTTMRFLLPKVTGRSGRKVTVEQFVDRVASEADEHGDVRRVKQTDGTVVTMSQWLRSELQRLEAAEAKADKGAGQLDSDRPPASRTR